MCIRSKLKLLYPNHVQQNCRLNYCFVFTDWEILRHFHNFCIFSLFVFIQKFITIVLFFFLPENVDDQVESESARRQVSEFKDFRMIDEIILELEKIYPSNSYENIIADQVNCTFNNFHYSLVRITQDVLVTFSVNSFLNRLLSKRYFRYLIVSMHLMHQLISHSNSGKMVESR